MVIFIILLGSSIGMVSTYSTIENKVNNYKINPYESEDLQKDLYRSSYVLYHEMLETKANKKIKPSEIFLNEELINENWNYNYSSNEDKYEGYKRDIDNRFNEWDRTLKFGLRNLEYYSIEKEKGTEVLMANKNLNLKTLLEENISKDNIEELNSYYDFYMVLDFDNKGDLTIKNLHGVEGDNIKNIFYNFSNNLFNNNIEIIKPITNATFVYAIPKNLLYSDNISNYVNRPQYFEFSRASGVFIAIGIIFIIGIGLILPYKYLIQCKLINRLVKIPFEIIFLIETIIMVFLVSFSSTIIMESVNGSILNELIGELTLGVDRAKIIIVAFNYIYWMVMFGVIILGVITLKHILKVGIKKYIIEYTFTFKIAKGIKGLLGNIYKYFINIDLQDSKTKKLIIILGINFIIMTVFSCIWFFGIIGAVIYTIILFNIMRKYISDIKTKYNKLLKVTNSISEGNLEVNIDEDLGIFNPFKDKISSIQNGFKKAVEEEVKSQRMKTELISNVSHDLKTPLTSIITYIDLLKEDGLTEEDKKQYLDTLDKKSQRLQELIEDLFEVSKAQSGNITLDIMEVDVVSLMKETLLELEDKIKEANLIVKTNFQDGKVILPLDSQRMFRVFENLVINITKYAMANTRVYIDIINNENTVEIVLKNMSAVEIDFNIEDITERFVRGDKSRNTEGAGLGLSIAKSFVELHNGSFIVNTDGDLFKVKIIFNKMR